jgi:TusA-related sulfurtransferase
MFARDEHLQSFEVEIATMTPDHELDITAEICPMTFVRTRLILDRMRPGQVLQVRLRGEEPTRNVPRTVVDQGHILLSSTLEPDGVTTLLIRRC